jgi:solute:Na+ symporter, SSS family
VTGLLVALIAILLAGMVGIGLWASRKQKTAEDFFVGGRRFGLFATTATQISTAFGGGVILAHVGVGYQWGLSVLVYSSIAAPLGVLLLAHFFARWLRGQNFYTTTDWMCHQYGESKPLRAVTSLTVALYAVAAAVAQPIAAGKILNVTTGLPFEVCVVIAAAVVVAYTMAGGIVAVAYTDVAQLLLMILLIVGILPLAISRAGGLDAVFASVPSENLTLTAAGSDVLLAWILAVLPAQMVKQTYHLRVFGAKTQAIAVRGLYNLAIASILAGIWAALLGMCIYAINPVIEDREHATIWAIQNLLPPAVAVVVLAATVAAIVAAADSALHSFSSSITRDIYQMVFKPGATDREIRKVSKLCVLAIGCVGPAIGIAVPRVLDALLLGYSITAAGLFFPLLLKRFWSGATGRGAIAGILAGVLMTIALSILDNPFEPMPPVGAGLLASLIALVLGSKLDRRMTSRWVHARDTITG